MENYKSYLEAENMIEMVKSQRADIMAQNKGFIYFSCVSFFKQVFFLLAKQHNGNHGENK